jgi:predicted ATPase
LCTGDIAHGLMHYNQALALYDPTAHRPLATRFGQDVRMASLSFRSHALWMLGYPEAALADIQDALKDAREIGLAATLMYALTNASLIHIYCGNYATANAEANELSALAGEKSALFWKASGMINQGCVSALTGKASDAVRIITSGIIAFRSTGATLWVPTHLSYLTRAYLALGQFDDAWRSIGEAMAAIEATKEKWCEADANRIAGEIALKSPEPMKRKRKSISSARSRSRVNSRQNPGNSAPP